MQHDVTDKTDEDETDPVIWAAMREVGSVEHVTVLAIKTSFSITFFMFEEPVLKPALQTLRIWPYQSVPVVVVMSEF